MGLQILVQGRILYEECVASPSSGSQNKYTLLWVRPALVAAFNATGICSWPTKISLASEFRSWYSNSIIWSEDRWRLLEQGSLTSLRCSGWSGSEYTARCQNTPQEHRKIEMIRRIEKNFISWLKSNRLQPLCKLFYPKLSLCQAVTFWRGLRIKVLRRVSCRGCSRLEYEGYNIRMRDLNFIRRLDHFDFLLRELLRRNVFD